MRIQHFDHKIEDAIERLRDTVYGTQVEKRPTLSVSMIVRDADGDLSILLPQLWFADEIVLIDTKPDRGMVEGEVSEVMSEWVNSVCPSVSDKTKTGYFPWNDSFADARNYSLSKCTGDWVLWLDADDRIPDGFGELVRAIIDKPGPLTKRKACHFTLRIKDIGKDSVFYCDQPRLFPNIGLEWRGRVHENYLDSAREKGLKDVIIKNLELVHTGYSDQELKIKKVERNVRLLEMEEQTSDVLFHLGKEHQAIENYDRAILYYQFSKEKMLFIDADARDHLRFMIGLCFYQNGMFKIKGVWDYLAGNNKKDSKFLLGEWYFFQGDFEKAELAYKTYLSFGEITDTRGTYQDSFKPMALNRIEQMERIGEYESTVQ